MNVSNFKKNGKNDQLNALKVFQWDVKTLKDYYVQALQILVLTL